MQSKNGSVKGSRLFIIDRVVTKAQPFVVERDGQEPRVEASVATRNGYKCEGHG